MTVLPHGWVATELGALLVVLRGVSYQKQDVRSSAGPGLIPLLRANGIQQKGIVLNDLVYVPERYVSDIQRLSVGDIVIAASSGSRSVVGKAARITESMPITFGAFCYALRVNTEISNELISYFLQSPEYRKEVSKLSAGININNLKREHIGSFPFSVPPINEQRRIVAKLDVLFEKSHAIRDKLDRVPRLLANLQKSILNAAFRGDLTREWRTHYGTDDGGHRHEEALCAAHNDVGGHKKGNAAPPTDGVHTATKDDLPQSWSLMELRDLCKPDKPICYGILKPGPEVSDGVPYIRVADFPNDALRLDSIRKTAPDIDAQFKRSRLSPGDLLISIRGTVGRMCVIPPQLANANITQDSARLAIQDAMNSNYVRYFLKSPDAQRRMDAATKGVAVRGINIGDLRAMQVPVPERAEQDQIVAVLDEMLGRIHVLEKQCSALLSQNARMCESSLSQAFRGELVPQDPSDEPASVLLDRIRTQRAEEPAKRSRSRKAASID